MRITIHAAQGQLIEQRAREMAQLMQAVAQFEVLRMEDKRQTDVLVKVAGYDPAKYSSYKLIRDGENYLLELVDQESANPAGSVTVPPPALVATTKKSGKHANGAA